MQSRIEISTIFSVTVFYLRWQISHFVLTKLRVPSMPKERLLLFLRVFILRRARDRVWVKTLRNIETNDDADPLEIH